MRWKRGTHREAPGASSLLDYGRRCIPRQASTHGSANVGLPRRNAPEALMLRPPHYPGAVVQGKDSLTTLFQSSASLWILTPNGASIVGMSRLILAP